MRTRLIGFFLFSLAALPLVRGQELKAPKKNEKAQPDYTEFSKLVQQIAVKHVPRFVEDNSGWGQTVPIAPNLRLPLLRKTVKVGNRLELPDGFWRKVRVSMKDPARDLKIQVRDFKKTEGNKFRLALDIEASLSASVEAQQWQKGLALIGFYAAADGVIGLRLESDLAVSFNAAKFPPEVKIHPTIATLKTALEEFNLRQVTTRRLGRVLEGGRAREVGNRVKDILQDLMRSFEPQIKDEANEAIAQAIKEGKGTISADAILKIMSNKPANPKH